MEIMFCTLTEFLLGRDMHYLMKLGCFNKANSCSYAALEVRVIYTLLRMVSWIILYNDFYFVIIYKFTSYLSSIQNNNEYTTDCAFSVLKLALKQSLHVLCLFFI